MGGVGCGVGWVGCVHVNGLGGLGGWEGKSGVGGVVVLNRWVGGMMHRVVSRAQRGGSD